MLTTINTVSLYYTISNYTSFFLGHRIVYDTLQILDNSHKYDNIIRIFSSIFNDVHDRAVTMGGRNIGKFTGALVLYMLEKRNKNWIIITKKGLEIS